MGERREKTIRKEGVKERRENLTKEKMILNKVQQT